MSTNEQYRVGFEAKGNGLVQGIGTYDRHVLCKAGSPELENIYEVWSAMLFRATPKNIEKNPTYIGTWVDPEFHYFSKFAKWAMQQIGSNATGYQMDKDLLVKGNRVYSPSTCVFLPKAVNVMLTRNNAGRGTLPIGVIRTRHGRFMARAKIDGKDIYFGTFPMPGDAFAAYKVAKEAQIKRVAERYRDQIDPRAYAALLAYQVEITD